MKPLSVILSWKKNVDETIEIRIPILDWTVGGEPIVALPEHLTILNLDDEEK